MSSTLRFHVGLTTVTLQHVMRISGLIVLLLCAHPPASNAQSTIRVVLAEGDIVDLSVIGIPELTQRVQVDASGHVVFPLIGEQQAAGLTESELRRVVQSAFERVVFRRAEPTGRDSQFAIAAQEVFLRVSEYAPIFVNGAVMRPGVVPYRAGLTVRQTLAVVGGVGAETDQPTPSSLLDLQSRLQVLRLDLSREFARNTRFRTALGMVPHPLPTGVRVRGDETVWTVEETALAAQRQNLQAQETRLQEAIEAAEQRTRTLSGLQRSEEEGASLDTAEIERTNDLFRRGLVNASRATDVRRNALFASSRALQTAVAASDSRRQKQEIETRLQRLRDDYRVDGLRELEQSEPRLQSLQEQINALDGRLRLSGRYSRPSSARSEVEVFLFRRGSDNPEGQSVRSDTQLLPGDVLEVRLATRKDDE